MTRSIKSQKTLGVFSAIGVAFTQGFEGIFVLLFGLIGALAVSMNEPFFAAGTLAAKEIIGIVIILLLFGFKTVKAVIKKIRSKAGLYFVIASSFGTMLGNFLYIVAISMAGSSYGTILTGLYPVFALLLIKLVLKEKESLLVKLGMLISILGGACFIAVPTIVNSGTIQTKTIVGMIMGALAAFFWAFESLFLKLAVNKEKPGENWSQQEIVTLRSMFTLLTTVIVVMPLSLIWGNPFVVFKDIFVHWESLLIIIGIGINIIILRMMHMYAIKTIGNKLTAIIDTNNFLVSPIFSLFLSGIPFLVYAASPGEGISAGDNLFTLLENWWAWFFVIPIILGAFMSIYFHEDNDEIKELDPSNK